METVNYIFTELRVQVILLGVSIAVYGLACLFAFKPWERKKLKKQRLTSPPSPIGYKRALLTLGDKPFMGVYEGSSPYSIIEAAAPNTPGFHSYYNLNSALAHPQPGNLYLEVLANGQVQHHELGMTSERQNVLQVMVGDCTVCAKAQAVYWLELPNGFHFMCSDCASYYAAPKTLADLELVLGQYCTEADLRPIVSTLKASSLGRAFEPSEALRTND